jgi:hypothetical protein
VKSLAIEDKLDKGVIESGGWLQEITPSRGKKPREKVHSEVLRRGGNPGKIRPAIDAVCRAERISVVRCWRRIVNA